MSRRLFGVIGLDVIGVRAGDVVFGDAAEFGVDSVGGAVAVRKR
jgi:hypothetical protein